MSDLELLKNINDVDDDLIFEAETWKPRKARKLKIAVISAVAAVIGALLAVTRVATINRDNSEKNVKARDHQSYLALEAKTNTATVEYLISSNVLIINLILT